MKISSYISYIIIDRFTYHFYISIYDFYNAFRNKVLHFLRKFIYVAGSSQVSKWTAFVLTIEDNDVLLWNPEIADHYKLSDSRCSLIKVSRLINHSGVSMTKIERSLILKDAMCPASILNRIITFISYFTSTIISLFSDMGEHAKVHSTSQFEIQRDSWQRLAPACICKRIKWQ